jgi:hypothetical protein
MTEVYVVLADMEGSKGRLSEMELMAFNTMKEAMGAVEANQRDDYDDSCEEAGGRGDDLKPFEPIVWNTSDPLDWHEVAWGRGNREIIEIRRVTIGRRGPA